MALQENGVEVGEVSTFEKLCQLYESGRTEVVYNTERYFVKFDGCGVLGEVGNRVVNVSFTMVDEECERLSGPTFGVFVYEKTGDFAPSAGASDIWQAFGVTRQFAEEFIDGFEVGVAS